MGGVPKGFPGYGPEAVSAAVAKAHAARAFGADYIANILRQQRQRREVQPPMQFKDPVLNELATDPLSLAQYDAFILHSRGSPVTALHQKLNQLSLTSMARQLDQPIADAAARCRSLVETLESLIDFEIESRNARSIERRFRLSRLHAQHSIDSFHFKHHKSRLDLKPRILRLLDLEFIAKGTGRSLSAIPAWAKLSSPRSLAGASVRPIIECCSPPPWNAESLTRLAGRPLADSQAPRLHRTYSTDR